MERLFRTITAHPALTLLVGGLVFLGLGAGLLRLRFDNQPNAFLPPEHPALINKQRVEQIFGLEDPMLLAIVVVDDDGQPIENGIFRPHPSEPLRVVETLSTRILELLEENRDEWGPPPVHPVYSLSTEFNVDMDSGIPEDISFLDPFPESQVDFDALREAVLRIELYTGVIVSKDGSAASIFIVPPPGHALEVFEAVRQLADEHERPGLRFALAGEAAVRSAMGKAVVSSAIQLNPVCVLVVVVFLILAFRSLLGVLLPMMVVGFGCAVMLGVMGWAGIPVYIITNSILVTVMSIGVADAIHILGEYYRECGRGSGLPRRDIVVRAQTRLWVPVMITSLTDIIGFASFYITGIMPPLRWFGVFTAVGVAATLIASFTLLPASLTLLDRAKGRRERLERWATTGPMVRLLGALGTSVRQRPGTWTLTGAALVVIGAWLASGLRVGQSMASTFESTSRIVQDDRLLNELFDGTYFLDVLIEGEEEGALLEPEVLRRIESLEEYAKSLDKVNGSISVTGFASKMNEILSGWDAEFDRIPDDAATVRENFELVERSQSKHADLERVLDSEYRRANVRLRLSSGEYDDEKPVVEAVESYLAEHFPPDGPVTAELAGRVYLDYHWVKLVVKSHIESLTLTCVLILVCLIVLFRSLRTGLLCMMPVAFAVLTVYAVMAALDIPLSVGTTMFASLAIGVGVNFPIHVVDRTRLALAENDGDLQKAYDEVFSITAKALAFNALAVCCGFLALLVSELPLMRHFGLMIAIGIGSCCAASLTFLPAVMAWGHRRRERIASQSG